ncbi:MAG: hypothetical protein ACXVI1_11920 [Halobacteriota archaeon]
MPQPYFLSAPFRVLGKTAVTTAATKMKGVKAMAKFLSLWRLNPSAPWPTDPAEGEKLNEMMWAAIELVKDR